MIRVQNLYPFTDVTVIIVQGNLLREATGDISITIVLEEKYYYKTGEPLKVLRM